MIESSAVVLFLTAFATAAVGTLVAWIAYNGYRRNDSEPMLYLSIGIALVTVGPFVVTYVVGPVIALSEASLLLGVLLAYVAGVSVIIYSLDGT